MSYDPLDRVSLWCPFALATVVGMFIVEGGDRLVNWRLLPAAEEQVTSAAEKFASSHGLVAFALSQYSTSDPLRMMHSPKS